MFHLLVAQDDPPVADDTYSHGLATTYKYNPHSRIIQWNNEFSENSHLSRCINYNNIILYSIYYCKHSCN